MPAWLMSESKASISARLGSWRSSWLTYRRTCSSWTRSASRLAACATLLVNSVRSCASRWRSVSNCVRIPLSTTYHRPTNTASATTSSSKRRGMAGQREGSLGSSPLNWDRTSCCQRAKSNEVGWVFLLMIGSRPQYAAVLKPGLQRPVPAPDPPAVAGWAALVRRLAGWSVGWFAYSGSGSSAPKN